MFFTNFVNQCNKKGESPSYAAEAMGFKRSVVTRWKNGTDPRQATLQKIADYFGCSVEDLTGKKEKPTTDIGDGFTDEQRLIFNKLMALPQEEREKKLQAIRLILDL